MQIYLYPQEKRLLGLEEVYMMLGNLLDLNAQRHSITSNLAFTCQTQL
jgi:hypothetical protein